MSSVQTMDTAGGKRHRQANEDDSTLTPPTLMSTAAARGVETTNGATAATMPATPLTKPSRDRTSIESGCFGLSQSQSPAFSARKEKRPRVVGPDIGIPTTPTTGETLPLPLAPPGQLFNDSVHGHMEVDPLCVAIIDTEQFQRLRNLKQLGVASLVFPSACHHRFEHSIGTSYLAGLMVERLRQRQPELGIDDQDVLCVKIAGLCHDLGHGPFSHTFELHVNGMLEAGSPPWEHEMASKAMFRHLIDVNELTHAFSARNLSEIDIQFIEELIAGVPPSAWADPATAPKGRPRDKSFLFEIVANKRNGVDVDKWDYFCRDSRHLNIKAPFDYVRYLLSVRVFFDSGGLRQICPKDKEVESIYDLWSTRSRLHRTAYQHKTVKVLERMLLELLREAEPYVLIPGRDGKLLKMSEAVTDPVAYTKLTDSVLLLIEVSTEPALRLAQELLSDIRRRRLYKFVGKAQPGAAGDANRLARAQLPTIQKEIALCIRAADADVVPADAIVLDLIKITHGPGKDDPIHNLRFWSKDDPSRTFKISPKEVSHMLPAHGEEVRLCVYCKHRDPQSKAVLTEALAQWCTKNSFEFQASPLEPSTPMRGLRAAELTESSFKAIPFNPSV